MSDPGRPVAASNLRDTTDGYVLINGTWYELVAVLWDLHDESFATGYVHLIVEDPRPGYGRRGVQYRAGQTIRYAKQIPTLDVSEAADMLGIEPSRVRGLIGSGKLKAETELPPYRIRPEELIAYLERASAEIRSTYDVPRPQDGIAR